MQSRAFIFTSVLFGAAIASLIACEPDASPRAKEAKAWVDKFYTKYTIRGGWGFFGSEAKDKNVFLEINVPDRQVQDLMKFPENERQTFIARTCCPPRSEEVWSILDPDGDLIVHTRHNGNRFAAVACKQNMKD